MKPDGVDWVQAYLDTPSDSPALPWAFAQAMAQIRVAIRAEEMREVTGV